MAFKRVNNNALPPRRWALKGYYGAGKSHFLLAMRGPVLMIDADGRRGELASADLYELSDEAVDHRSPERIQDILARNMPKSGIRTIGVDSITSLIGGDLARAMLDNANGVNKNKASAFVEKAEKMRLLQDAITAHGTDVLFIWHLEDGRDAQAKEVVRETLPETERERLRRSLNAELRVVQDDRTGQRGIRVDWSREGPAGMVIWDEEGYWKGVPEKVEAAIYSARREGQPARPGTAASPAQDGAIVFRSKDEAILYGVEQGAFVDYDASREELDRINAGNATLPQAERSRIWIERVRELKQPERRTA